MSTSEQMIGVRMTTREREMLERFASKHAGGNISQATRLAIQLAIRGYEANPGDLSPQEIVDKVQANLATMRQLADENTKLLAQFDKLKEAAGMTATPASQGQAREMSQSEKDKAVTDYLAAHPETLTNARYGPR
jgi:hypothetical protein